VTVVLEESLYAFGWRQGSVFRADLPLGALVLSPDGVSPDSRQTDHGVWIVATQDCDLAFLKVGNNEPSVEVRPVYDVDPPTDWGIRSSRLLVEEQRYVVGDSPRLTVSPALLQTYTGVREPSIADGRLVAFKTWLGLRYDRPAVPPHLVPLAKRIGEEVRDKKRRLVGRRVRDLLMQFDDSLDPPRYSLFAVLESPEDHGEVREWLADIARSVPRRLGIADRFDAATADETAFSLVETSYAADVAQVTWSGPEPEGAQ